MRKRHTTLILTCLLVFSVIHTAPAAFVEPTMVDYTAMPIFLADNPQPNIMIILDNSGSMNFNAYGTWPGGDQTVSDQPFEGEPYSQMKSYKVQADEDDCEELTTVGDTTRLYSGDLDMAGFSAGNNDVLVGLRFTGLDIPQGAVIQNAYIEFRGNANNSLDSSFTIEVEDIDNAPAFSAAADNLKNRTMAAVSADWDSVVPWTTGSFYPTPDLAPVLQQIVDRVGWATGNSVVFKISAKGTTDNKRDATAHDNSSTNAPVLHVVFGDDPGATKYYGLFNPDFFYKYDSTDEKFDHAYKKVNYDTGAGQWNVETLLGAATTLTDANIVGEELWDGNWLNWLSMRRIDIMRKVLMGGLATNRDGSGKQINIGEDPIQGGRDFFKVFNSSLGSAVSPYDGNFSYEMDDGDIVVSGDRYKIRVQKDSSLEPEEFLEDGNLSGVIQRVGDKARWGNMWFNSGSGSGNSGGFVDATIGTDITTLITDLQNQGCDTWTPLAETFYVAMQYFRQQDPAGGLDYAGGVVPHSGTADDPYYNADGDPVACAKSFVILLTDGASTKDEKIPNTLKDYDNDGDNVACNESSNSNCDYPSGGTDFLDDLALYAHTVDLRSDLADTQTLDLYTVYAFGNDPNARQLLQDAARNGGFNLRRDDNLVPDETDEWDDDGDGIPDTFFEGSDGYALEAQLIKVINSILTQTASGTSASVLATNSEGQGNMLQAYFNPLLETDDAKNDVAWAGFMQSLWVDAYGHLYQDTDGDQVFDDPAVASPADEQIEFDTCVTVNGTEFTGFRVVGETDCNELSELKSLFEVSDLLSKKDPDSRKIFTFIDKDRDGVADDSGNDPLDVLGEVIVFDTGTSSELKPYLGVRSDTVWGDNGVELGSDHDTRVENIITWVRGTDVPGLRNRTQDGITYRLGDVVNSTPVTVTTPPEKFHIFYGDESYKTYFDKFEDREGVIYVGSNDGMLHAFTNHRYDPETRSYDSSGISEKLGEEIWAFIPQTVLPHLKWSPQKTYTHTFLVDAKPRIFDAKIIPDGLHYSDGQAGDDWGTILVMGLNMGARQIDVYEDFGSGLEQRTFDPTYICMDITNPRKPRLLWERSYPGLNMSRSTPSPVKVEDKWYLVFGSGPQTYEGSSAAPGYIYVADMKTGDMLNQYGPYDANAFFGSPAAFDKNLNYNVDGIYIGNAYENGGVEKGSIYKIAVPCTTCEWDSGFDAKTDTVAYDTDPNNWLAHKLFDADRPITAPPSLSVELVPEEDIDNVWVYFGTGRFIAEADKITNEQEYIYGVKDPFFNRNYKTSARHDYAVASGITLDIDDLFQSDVITVTTDGHVLKGTGLFGTGYFDYLVDEIRGVETDPLPPTQPGWDGWYRHLETNGTQPSERMISKPSILGGISFFPVYTPSDEICDAGGSSNIYALYYITGTGYTKQLFDILNPDTVSVTIDGNTQTEEVVAVKLTDNVEGSPPPSLGMHAGKEKGAKAFMQMSTGVIVEIDVDTAMYTQSMISDWWDRIENQPVTPEP